MYSVTKTYGAERGLSAAFRQWKANSHCNLIHGYALSITLVFHAEELDSRDWVIDFGCFGPIKAFLDATFDHRLLVAGDDPDLDELCQLDALGLASVLVLENGVGCERFAEHIGGWITRWLQKECHAPRVRLHSVEVREHAGNAATFFPTDDRVRELKVAIDNFEKVAFNKIHNVDN